jgi:phage gp45-like
MHNATPAHTSFRSYYSGGSRSVIHEADDSKFMQEMKGNFMKGESRGGVESPQNYGFTSVVHDADKGQDGSVSDGAEGFVQFMGGNRSFPVCPVMDDRRHRLWGMEKGDTAMYRGKDDGQQFHMTTDGGFWSAQTEKTVRMQLVDKQQNQQQGGGSGGSSGGGASALAGEGGGGGTDPSGGGGSGSSTGKGDGTSQSGKQQKGQKPIYKQGVDKSYRYVDVTKDATRLSGKESHLMLEDKDSYVHCKEKKTYLGGNADKHKFARVLTEAGVAQNVYGKIDGSMVALELETEMSNVLERFRPRSRLIPPLVPALMLLLGISLGANYALITERGPTMIASLVSR